VKMELEEVENLVLSQGKTCCSGALPRLRLPLLECLLWL